MAETKILLDGLVFPEGPRWRDGKLWLSDMHDHRVLTVDLNGTSETVCEVEHQPSGLGWLPDARLLVVSMADRRLLRLEPHGLVEHADLSSLATHHCNDMVVDTEGRAYVGNFGSEISGGETPISVRASAQNSSGLLGGDVFWTWVWGQDNWRSYIGRILLSLVMHHWR